MSDICHRCGACVWGVEDGLCEDCRDDIKAQEKVEKTGKVEKADNGLTVGEHYENLLDKDKIFDLDTIFKDTWAGPKYTIEYKTTKGGKGTFYFNSIKKLFETLKVQYKTSLLDRVEADVETIFTLGFDSAEHCSVELCPLITRISEVKSAISKIRGEEK